MFLLPYNELLVSRALNQHHASIVCVCVSAVDRYGLLNWTALHYINVVMLQKLHCS